MYVYLLVSGASALRTHHTGHYKYHVPSKITGTLPRDKKKAAAIGKAVAKGRSTIKKKIVPPPAIDKVSHCCSHFIEELITCLFYGLISDEAL